MKTFGEVDATCPKCGQPLRRAYDGDQWHMVCLPCGYAQLADATPVGKPLYKATGSRAEPEHDIQAAFFEECAIRAVRDERWELPFAIANGGKRGPKTAAKLKQEGVKAGVPDIFVAHHGYCADPFGDAPARCDGLFIEFKAGRNTLSPAQAERARLAEKYGYHVEVCRSAEEAIALLERWFKGEEV